MRDLYSRLNRRQAATITVGRGKRRVVVERRKIEPRIGLAMNRSEHRQIVSPVNLLADDLRRLSTRKKLSVGGSFCLANDLAEMLRQAPYGRFPNVMIATEASGV